MNYNIPESEVANFISIYWQMLKELEQNHCEHDPMNKHLVEGAFRLLNRAGVIDARPFWIRKGEKS